MKKLRNSRSAIRHVNMLAIPLNNMEREHFIYYYKDYSGLKWEAFNKIKSDWKKKYGDLDHILYINGKAVSFISKLKWAFKYIDEHLTPKKNHGKLIYRMIKRIFRK